MISRKISRKNKMWAALAGACVLTVGAAAQAQLTGTTTISVSNDAPTGSDISQPDFSNSSSGNTWNYTNFNWGVATGVPAYGTGQVFMPDADLTLDSFTMKGNGDASTMNGGSPFTIQVFSSSGTTWGSTVTLLDTETADPTPINNATGGYITFTLQNPIALTSGQAYGFDVYSGEGGATYLGFAQGANGVTTTGASAAANAQLFSDFSAIAAFGSGSKTFYINGTPGAAPLVPSSVDGTWITNGDGNWDDATNWSSNPQFPGNGSINVDFSAVASSPTVTLAEAVSMENLIFDNPNGYTINGSGSIGMVTSTPDIVVTAGNNTINVPVHTSAGTFYFDVNPGAGVAIPNFSDGSYGSITVEYGGSVTIPGGFNGNLTVADGSTITFMDSGASGFLYGVNINGGSKVNLGANTWNTNTIADDGSGTAVINVPAGGTLYTAEYLGASTNPGGTTMFYSGKFTGAGNIVIGEGNSATDTTQIIYGNTAFFSGDNSGFSGTMTAGMSFPSGTTYMTQPARFTLAVQSASGLGDGSATNKVILDGGILQSDGSFAATQNIVVTANGGTIDTDGYPGGDNTQPVISGGTVISFGAISGSDPAAVVTKINDGKLTTTQITNVGLVVNGGTVQLAPNGTPAGASSLNSLVLATDSNYVPLGSLDITNNSVSILAAADADPISSIVGYLKTAYDKGAWDGAGIQSSAVASQPGTGIGYADGNIDTGTAAASGIILVKDTWIGDVNLDGLITPEDMSVLTSNFGKTGMDWAQGDLNYDGVVNGDDWALFALGAAEFKAGGSVAVPEPASVGMLAVLGAGLLRRRRR